MNVFAPLILEEEVVARMGRMLKFRLMDIPTEMPVMTLPNAVLFPQALMPLYIFEPRYRCMLRHSLDSHRMLAVALARPGVSCEGSAVPHDVAAVGVIRACIDNEDGTSNLILQGIQRVQIEAMVRRKPFPLARVRPVASVQLEPTASGVDTLAARVTELAIERAAQFTKLPEQISHFLSEIKDPDMLADILGYTLVSDPRHKQRLLETRDVHRRLEELIPLLSTPAQSVVDADKQV